MNIRYPFSLLTGSAALLLGLTACSQDETADGNRLPEGKYPLVIEASGLQTPVASTPSAMSRATVDNAWDGNETIALQVQGNDHIYTYTVNQSGLMASENPYYWTSHDPITVSAWYPYGETMTAVVVKEDQSSPENFAASDFVSAERQTVNFNSPVLKFTHRTARVTMKLKAGSGVADVAGAIVNLLNLSTENGNPAIIRTCNTEGSTYDALLAPQTVAADMPLIRIELNDNVHTARLPKQTTLNGGYVYTYNVTVTDKGLKVEEGSIQGWEDGGGETGTASEIDYIYDELTNTYTVFNIDGLNYWAAVAIVDLGTNCILGADITLEDGSWTVIGNNSTPYTGTFNGNNFTISNLTINSTSNSSAGMFGALGDGAAVRNLNLADVNISGSQYIGGITGFVQKAATISNCSVLGSLSGTNTIKTLVGGITGENEGTVSGCRFSGTITGISYLGGIAGDNYKDNALIIACAAECQINGDKGNSYSRSNGGITGSNEYGSIVSSFSRCSSITGNSRLGAIAGNNFDKIKACYWDTFSGDSVGYSYGGSQETTKVDDASVTWSDAIAGMNAAIETWNTENPDNTCPYSFVMGEDGAPEIQ